jgi:hypothetical protein
MKSTSIFLLFALVATLATRSGYGKDAPAQVITWPDSGAPVIRISFGKFKESGSNAGQRNYTSDTTVENLWGKPIARADFSLYLFDKNKVRIGEGWISLSNVGRAETIKFQTAVMTSGTPVSLALAPRSLPDELQSFLPSKTIEVTVNSVPQGAELKVDGVAAGTTPKLVKITPGKHVLQFSKEGFNSGSFPLEMGSNDVSGGSVSYELGTSAHDTIELRDGTLLSGDLVSLTGMDVVIKLGGADQHVDRNQIKRILFVQRQPVTASP